MSAPKQAYNDSAFLYLIFTAQFFFIFYLSISLVRAFLTQSKTSTRSKVIKSVLLVFILFWFFQVISLIQEDTQVGEFDPYKILGVSQDSAFNSSPIKKAYRNQAIKYHPDKHADKSD